MAINGQDLRNLYYIKIGCTRLLQWKGRLHLYRLVLLNILISLLFAVICAELGRSCCDRFFLISAGVGLGLFFFLPPFASILAAGFPLVSRLPITIIVLNSWLIESSS